MARETTMGGTLLRPAAGLAAAAGVLGSFLLMLRAGAAAGWTTIVLTVLSLAVYARLIPAPRGTAPAFVFVMWPVASWMVIALVAAVLRSWAKDAGPPA